jgi:hypothetical protein
MYITNIYIYIYIYIYMCNIMQRLIPIGTPKKDDHEKAGLAAEREAEPAEPLPPPPPERDTPPPDRPPLCSPPPGPLCRRNSGRNGLAISPLHRVCQQVGIRQSRVCQQIRIPTLCPRNSGSNRPVLSPVNVVCLMFQTEQARYFGNLPDIPAEIGPAISPVECGALALVL